MENVDKTDVELVEFIRKAAIDGRYVDKLLDEPETAAQNLNIDLSSEALERLKTYDYQAHLANRSIGPTAAIIHVAIIAIIVLSKEDPGSLIIDKSGLAKL